MKRKKWNVYTCCSTLPPTSPSCTHLLSWSRKQPVTGTICQPCLDRNGEWLPYDILVWCSYSLKEAKWPRREVGLSTGSASSSWILDQSLWSEKLIIWLPMMNTKILSLEGVLSPLSGYTFATSSYLMSLTQFQRESGNVGTDSINIPRWVFQLSCGLFYGLDNSQEWISSEPSLETELDSFTFGTLFHSSISFYIITIQRVTPLFSHSLTSMMCIAKTLVIATWTPNELYTLKT